MEKLNYQNKTTNRTSSTKKVFVGKGKHLPRAGNSFMLRKHNWEYLWRQKTTEQNQQRTPEATLLKVQTRKSEPTAESE